MLSVLLYFPVGLGDHLRYHGIVREYCKKYDRVAIFSVPETYSSVSFMYRDIKNLTIIKRAYYKGEYTLAKRFIFMNKFKFGKYKYDLVKVLENNNLNKYSNLTFEEQIYQLAGVEFTKKWDSFFVERNLKKEMGLYNETAPKENYAFLHEDRSRNFEINRKKIDKKLKVYIPDDRLAENIFDFCTTIERATEIHVIDSSFMFLVDCLKYENPKQKLFIHRYARENDKYLLPVLKKNWNIINSFESLPKFCVVIPVYNNEKYLTETIESVLSQEGPFFIDCIIINHWLKDEIVKIVKKYDELLTNGASHIKRSRVKIKLSQSNGNNKSLIINREFKMSNGEIYSWINPGDLYEPSAFRSTLKEFEKDQRIDLIYGDTYKYRDNQKKELIRLKQTSFDNLLKNDGKILQFPIFFTKKALRNAGFLDETLQYAMILDLWIKIAKNSKIFHVPIALTNCKVKEKSETILFDKKFNEEMKIILWKYKSGIITPKFINYIKSRNLFLGYINKKMPQLYSYSKRKFYSIVSFFHY